MPCIGRPPCRHAVDFLVPQQAAAMNSFDPAAISEASPWDQRYREGSRWELGQPAPPLARFLRDHPLAPQPPVMVVAPGCRPSHEGSLLAQLGFSAIGLDFSVEALREARSLYGRKHIDLQWLKGRPVRQVGARDGGSDCSACFGATVRKGVHPGAVNRRIWKPYSA